MALEINPQLGASPLATDDLEKPVERQLSPTSTDKGSAAFLSFADIADGDEALQLFKELGIPLDEAEGNLQVIDEAKLKRRLDITILPLIAGIYLLQFLDKTLLSYSAIMGLREDTHLEGNQYTQVSLAFYAGFLIAEIPTTYFAQRSGRMSKYVALNVILWGIMLGCTAACNNFSGLFAVRFFLGVFESCVAPCLVLIVAAFYKKNEQAKRISAFYVMNGFAIIIGSFAGYGFSFLTTDFAGWRAMYLVFGGLTVVHGILCLLLLPDSPVKAPFLTKPQRLQAIVRLRSNQSGTQSTHWKLYQAMEVLRDPKVLLVWLLVMLTTIPNGSISNYSSIIINNLGYTKKQALLLTAPGGGVAIITTLSVGFIGDRFNNRSVVILIAIVPALIGAALLVANDNKGSALAGVWLVYTFGSSFSTLLSYNASNVAGHTKKVVTNAMTLIFFSVGNILGTETFQAHDAPDYIPGKITILVCFGLCILFTGVLRLTLHFANKKKRLALEEMTEEEKREGSAKMAFADETDLRNPFFRYTN